MQHPSVLYVGDTDRGAALREWVELAGWSVFLPTETMEALAMYISYLPDIVVIDTTYAPEMTAVVLYHLQSVDAYPLVLLTTEGGYSDGYTLSADVTPRELMAAIRAALADSQPITA
jgi:DNA-binding response OmpR family regulator